MKNKIKRLSIFILSLLIVSGGVIFIFHDKITTHFIPAIEQIGDLHIQIKNDTAYITSKLTAKNKSFLRIKVDTLKYKITLFNKTYLQNKKLIGKVLRGYGKDTLEFSLKIPYVTILKDLKIQRKKGDSASYSINIFLQYSTVFGKSEIPITKSARLKIPQPPELEIIGIKYKKIRWKSILADAKIKIANYSNVTLQIKKVSYSIDILKQGKMKGDYIEPITIKPNGTTYIILPIKINANNLGKTLFEILINKDTYDYILKLNAIIESVDSLKKSFQIDIIKEGRMELRK